LRYAPKNCEKRVSRNSRSPMGDLRGISFLSGRLGWWLHDTMSMVS
jgi:hypothetical protein